MPEKKHKLTLSFPESAAWKIDAEAQMEGVTAAEYVRRALGQRLLIKSVERDIIAQFPIGSELEFSIGITVSDGSTIKVFEVDPNMHEPGGSHIKLIDEYPKSQD